MTARREMKFIILLLLYACFYVDVLFKTEYDDVSKKISLSLLYYKLHYKFYVYSSNRYVLHRNFGFSVYLRLSNIYNWYFKIIALYYLFTDIVTWKWNCRNPKVNKIHYITACFNNTGFQWYGIHYFKSNSLL